MTSFLLSLMMNRSQHDVHSLPVATQRVTR